MPERARLAAAGLALGLLMSAGSASASADCGADLPAAGRQRIAHPLFTLAFAPQPAPVPLGQPFALQIRLCPSPGQGQGLPHTLRVDAEMPAHRHGMNYRAQVQADGGGSYRAQGLMFHMPGLWRLHFDLDRGPGQPPLRLSADLSL